MVAKVPRIGFDFDGVIAYNPLRVLRRPGMWMLEKMGLKKKSELHYPVPQGHHNRFVWAILHETSFFPSYGLSDLAELMRQKKIKAYLITGRYSFLKNALMRWLRYRGIADLFEEIYLNDKDEQPHIYKEKMLKKLKLDMYIEDNWDIVAHLNKTLNKKKQTIEVHWIYNLLDRTMNYEHKHPYMKKFIDYLKGKSYV